MVLLAVCLHAALDQRAHPVRSQHASTAEVASVRRFVQGFYDWYTPLVLRLDVDSELVALKKKGNVFTPELRNALWEDWTAQSKEPGFIVGLEFDPFTNSQDPNNRYVVGKIAPKGNAWLVGVHGVPTKKEPYVSKLTAHVQKGPRGWVFANFYYEGADNLLAILAGLKKDRRENPAKTPGRGETEASHPMRRDQLQSELNKIMRSYGKLGQEGDLRLSKVAKVQGDRAVRLRAIGYALKIDADKLSAMAALARHLDAAPEDEFIKAAYVDFFDRQAVATREWANACFTGTPKLRADKARASHEVTLDCYEKVLRVLESQGANVQRDRDQIVRFRREWLGR